MLVLTSIDCPIYIYIWKSLSSQTFSSLKKRRFWFTFLSTADKDFAVIFFGDISWREMFVLARITLLLAKVVVTRIKFSRYVLHCTWAQLSYPETKDLANQSPCQHLTEQVLLPSMKPMALHKVRDPRGSSSWNTVEHSCYSHRFFAWKTLCELWMRYIFSLSCSVCPGFGAASATITMVWPCNYDPFVWSLAILKTVWRDQIESGFSDLGSKSLSL